MAGIVINWLHIYVYFSQIDSSYIHSTDARTDYFNRSTEQINKYDCDSDICIYGDLNTRTVQLDDYPEPIPDTAW